MKKIKEKVRDQSPKIRNPASRLPKELVRSAMLEAKEKSSIMADKIGRKTGEESPVEYAGNRIQSVEQRVGKESASAAYRGGKKLAVKTYEKLKAQKQKQREAATTPLGEDVPFPVSWTVKMKKKQKETQDILSYHSQAAGCSDKARAKASGGRQPIEECGRTGL